MILLYHHVGSVHQDENWVSEGKFLADVEYVTANKAVVALDVYDPANPDHVVISFDDGFRDILKFAVPLMRDRKLPFEVFLVDSFQQKAFATQSSVFMDRGDLQQVLMAGGKLQYHTRSHADLTTLSAEQLEEEVILPEYLKCLDPFGFRYLAYPYCRYNEKVLEAVAGHYAGAVSGKGFGCDENPFALDRIKMTECVTLPLPTRMPS